MHGGTSLRRRYRSGQLPLSTVAPCTNTGKRGTTFELELPRSHQLDNSLGVNAARGRNLTRWLSMSLVPRERIDRNCER